MRPDKLGINESHWSLIRQILLQPIWDAGGRVWVFGSRSRGDYSQFSDLDLLIEGIEDSTLISCISERLEESTLPFRVDVVRESDLAESYREVVYKERIVLDHDSGT